MTLNVDDPDKMQPWKLRHIADHIDLCYTAIGDLVSRMAEVPPDIQEWIDGRANVMQGDLRRWADELEGVSVRDVG